MKLPYGLTIINVEGTWFVEQRTLREIKSLAAFDEKYKAVRFVISYVLGGRAA
jgi:hypothetical protein